MARTRRGPGPSPFAPGHSGACPSSMIKRGHARNSRPPSPGVPAGGVRERRPSRPWPLAAPSPSMATPVMRSPMRTGLTWGPSSTYVHPVRRGSVGRSSRCRVTGKALVRWPPCPSLPLPSPRAHPPPAFQVPLLLRPPVHEAALVAGARAQGPGADARRRAAGHLRPGEPGGRGRAGSLPGRRPRRRRLLGRGGEGREDPARHRRRRPGHLRGLLPRGRRLRRRGRARAPARRVEPRRGEVHHQGEGPSLPRRRRAAPRPPLLRPRREAIRPHAPELRVHVPGPAGPLHPRRRDRRGRGPPPRRPRRDPAAPDGDRGRPPRRRARPALHRPVRVPVHGPLLARAARAPRLHALPDRQARPGVRRGRVRDHPRPARRRAPHRPDGPAGPERPVRESSWPRTGSPVRSRPSRPRLPSSTSRPSTRPSPSGTAAIRSRRSPCR